MTTVAIDTTDVIPLLKALNQVSAEVRVNANRRLREAAGECSRGLVVELGAAAARSATPQAALVARTLRVSSDRVPKVQVGGSRKVGSRKTPAGLLVWGSERGGRNFAASSGGAYWIAPTVSAYSRTRAVQTYQAAVAAILRDAGVI